MVVALRLVGGDARGLDGELDRRALRLRPIDLDRAREVRELAAHHREDVADLEPYGGVRLVELVGVGGEGGGRHHQGRGEHGPAVARRGGAGESCLHFLLSCLPVFGSFRWFASVVTDEAVVARTASRRWMSSAVRERSRGARARRPASATGPSRPASRRRAASVAWAEDLPSVLRAANAAHEVPRLEPIEEAGDAGAALDHAGGDVEGGEAPGAGAAEDAKHVVLLQGDLVRLDHARQRGPDAVGGAEQRDDRLVSGRAERLRLPDLVPDRSHLADKIAADYLTSQVKCRETLGNPGVLEGAEPPRLKGSRVQRGRYG